MSTTLLTSNSHIKWNFSQIEKEFGGGNLADLKQKVLFSLITKNK